MAYSADDLAALGEVVRRHPNIAVATDDMYEKILFDGKKFATFAQINPDLKLIGRAVRASKEELERNPRARSATMRVAERTTAKVA